MPRQLDQLPTDATTLARKVAALEKQVNELRAARRMGTATVGRLRVYSGDGQTLLAELGPTADGGGGLQTYGSLGIDEIPVTASLTSGELNFQPVDSGISAVPARASYDAIPETGTDLQLSSGSVSESDWAAVVDVSSVAGGGPPAVLVSGFRDVAGVGESGACNMDVAGVLTSSNWAYGSVSITPSAANTPTSANVTGLSVDGSTFIALVSANTSVPGSQVTGVGFSSLTSAGLTVWLTRTNTTATNVTWMVIGL